jgi:ankyrin repeat protein
VNYITAKGATALYTACQKNHVRIAKCLLGHGADIELTGFDSKYRPLHIAVQHNAYECIALLLDAGANPWAITDKGFTPQDLCQNKAASQIMSSRIENNTLSM